MKSVLAFVLVIALATAAEAQTRATPLRDAVTRVAVPSARMARTPASRPIQSQDSWPARHPVLLGTLVGFGVGFPIGYATCKCPSVEGPCDIYTYPQNARMAGGFFIGGLGAGIGAAVGGLISATRR